MTDDDVRRAIDELEGALAREAIEEVERGLARDDPAFVRGIEDRWRVENAVLLAVGVLLAAGAVLLTVGLATFSWPVWVAGLLAFLGALAVNALHDRAVAEDRSIGASQSRGGYGRA
jgi:hypothetical protein